MAHLHPYLTFNGNCRQAMEFYQTCLGGKLDLMPVAGSPMAAELPSEVHNQVLHSYLTDGKLTLMASDTVGQTGYQAGNTVALCLVCDSKTEIESLFAQLSAGGKIDRPLKEEFFGTYGDLTDKFGMKWMFQYSPNPQM